MSENSALDPSAGPVANSEPAPRKKRGWGVTALVFALLAVLGDVLVLAIGIGSIRTLDDSTAGALGLLAVFVVTGGVTLIVGLVVAGIALLLAVIGLIVGSGRGPAAFALVLSILTVLGHVILLVAIGSLGSGLAGLGG